VPYFDGLPDVLDRALRAVPEPRFDAIVVDEGQDLDSVWWLPLLDLLRRPATGIVYVFGDANQDLYHAREPEELGVVMPESPPVFHLNENRRATQAIHSFASRWASPPTDAPAPMSVGPEGRRVEIFTYINDADACRKVLGTALRRLIDAGRVAASDVVVLTPRSNRSSWPMGAVPVEAWPFRLMPEYGPEGAVLPPPTKGNEVRVATIHRYKGLESPVVVLAEIDGRVADEDLAALLYVGARLGLGRTSWSLPRRSSPSESARRGRFRLTLVAGASADRRKCAWRLGIRPGRGHGRPPERMWPWTRPLSSSSFCTSG